MCMYGACVISSLWEQLPALFPTHCNTTYAALSLWVFRFLEHFSGVHVPSNHFFFLCLLFMSYWQTIKRVLGLPRFCFRFVDLTLQIRITDVADVCCLSCCLCICNCTCRCLIFSHRSTSGVLIVSMPLPPTTNTTMVSGQETCWQTRNWSARA